MKKYQITYALSREDENIYTTTVNAWDMADAMDTATAYIDKEHGFPTSNKIAAISILELKQ